MPQFEAENFIPQLVWLAIFFAILYFGVVRLTLPKLGRVMETREQTVSDDLDTAQRAKTEADAIQAQHDADVAQAQDAARVRVGQARSAATAALETKLAESNAALNARVDAAQASLDQARASAMTEIEAVAADVASDLVEKLTSVRPEQGTAASAARAALA